MKTSAFATLLGGLFRAVEKVQPDSGTSDREALHQLHSGSCPQRWIYFGPCFGSTARRLWCCQAVTGAGWQPLWKACYCFALPSILGPCVVPSGHSAWRQHRPAAACLDARHLPRAQSMAPRSWMLDHIACRRDRTVHPELGLRDGVHVFDRRQPWRPDLPKPTVGPADGARASSAGAVKLSFQNKVFVHLAWAPPCWPGFGCSLVPRTHAVCQRSCITVAPLPTGRSEVDLTMALELLRRICLKTTGPNSARRRPVWMLSLWQVLPLVLLAGGRRVLLATHWSGAEVH